MKLTRFLKKLNKFKPVVFRQVVGSSMLPRLDEGNIVIASGWFRKLQPHDVVIIKHEGLEKIKRVQHVDKDKLYVVGDNDSFSTDSRHFGWIDNSYVLAKVLWPLNSENN